MTSNADSALHSPSTGLKCSRVAVVDDHTMMREGVRLFLDTLRDFECAWMAGTAGEGITHLEQDPPDVLIVDLTLPDRHGLEFIKEAHSLAPAVPIMVLSMHDEHIYAPRALKAGAKGYLMKDTPNDVFANALRMLLSGSYWLSREVNDEILTAFSSGSVPVEEGLLHTLTERERELFDMIGDGLSTQEIAAAMQISPKTVDVHRSNIRSKLQLPDGVALARFATQWVESKGSIKKKVEE